MFVNITIARFLFEPVDLIVLDTFRVSYSHIGYAKTSQNSLLCTGVSYERICHRKLDQDSMYSVFNQLQWILFFQEREIDYSCITMQSGGGYYCPNLHQMGNTQDHRSTVHSNGNFTSMIPSISESASCCERFLLCVPIWCKSNVLLVVWAKLLCRGKGWHYFIFLVQGSSQRPTF